MQNHLIQQQFVEIAFRRMEEGLGMQDRVAAVFYEKLQPRMELLFNEMVDEKHTAFIESMEIDCGILPEKNWEEEWVEAAVRGLREKLLQVDKKTIDSERSGSDFIYFLQHGVLPWNSRIQSVQDFEASLDFNDHFLAIVLTELQEEALLKRMLNQFSENFVNRLLKALNNYAGGGSTGVVLADEESSSRGVPHARQEKLFAAITTSLKKIFSKKIPGGTKDEMPTTAADKNTAPPGELFVNNAGLVICHPLLPALFERLSLMQEQRWVNEAAQYRAVMLTAFLASGEDQPPEFVLALNKILCGLETSTVLPAMEELTAAEKTACDEMLEGLIAHWTALKNTGPAALRQTFLQRSGKLTATGSGRRLQVEQKTVDVLLNTLPWGIGVIRLPWMKELLFTEWN